MTRRAFFTQVAAFVAAFAGIAKTERGQTRSITSNTATTITDSSQAWPLNQWQGGMVTVVDWRGRCRINNVATGLDWDAKTIIVDFGNTDGTVTGLG